jgi:ADP-ribosylglycohydrolase
MSVYSNHINIPKKAVVVNQAHTRTQRITNALKTQFIADALAMPVHWYYQPMEIELAFKGGIAKFEAAPSVHPSSIMSLHSKRKGGRASVDTSKTIEVVGDVILQDKAQFWDTPSVHYHQGMPAGENTLNAYCTRVLIEVLSVNKGHYNREHFVQAYIELMTAQPPKHPDTYAESYHRGFFANYAQGRKPEKCAMLTHDTASVGALVTIAPLVFSQRMRGASEHDIQVMCRAHLALTHPDESLMQVCDRYVVLLCALMEGPEEAEVKALLVEASKGVPNLDLAALVKRDLPDHQIIGHIFSRACYISDSWPAVLFLAYKYYSDPWQALRVNTNVGGDNVHRGAVLGAIMGLQNDEVANTWFNQLLHHDAIAAEIDGLVTATV